MFNEQSSFVYGSCQIGLTVKEFCILRDIDTPAHEIVMHLYCGDDRILIDIDICGVQPIQLGIRVNYMTPSFG
jgi:hypothetical protein